MKKTLLLFVLALAGYAQVGQTPPNGSNVPFGQPTNFCWEYGNNQYSNMPAQGAVDIEIVNGSSIIAASGYFTPASGSCITFTPTSQYFSPSGAVLEVYAYFYAYPGAGFDGWFWQAQYTVVPAQALTYTPGDSLTGSAPLAQPATPNDDGSVGFGAVSYWSADGTTADLVSGYNGVWEYGSAYATGYLGSAFSFNGSDFIQISGSGQISGARTWAFWVYPNTQVFGPNTAIPIVGFGQSGQADVISVQAGNQLLFEHYPSGSVNGPMLNANAWNHVVVTYDGNAYMQFYVNGVASQVYYTGMWNYPISQAYFGHNPTGGTISGSTYAGLLDEVYYYNSVLSASGVQTLYTAQMAKPRPVLDTHIHVQTSRGMVDVKRGDLINIGDLSYQFSSVPGGQWKYTYQLDNREVANIRLGFVTDGNLDAVSSTQPKHWSGSGMGGWSAFIDPEYSATAVYTVNSTRAPGLLPMYFQSDVDNVVAAANGQQIPVGFPAGKSKDNMKIATAMNIFNNSVQRWVIGPVFPPGVTKVDVLAKVKSWVNDYGMTFLQPLLDGGNLADVAPETPLDQDIVNCLAAFLH